MANHTEKPELDKNFITCIVCNINKLLDTKKVPNNSKKTNRREYGSSNTSNATKVTTIKTTETPPQLFPSVDHIIILVKINVNFQLSTHTHTDI